MVSCTPLRPAGRAAALDRKKLKPENYPCAEGNFEVLDVYKTANLNPGIEEHRDGKPVFVGMAFSLWMRLLVDQTGG